MRVEFYRSVSRLLVCVLCAASVYVTADAQTPGQNIDTVSGTKWPGRDPCRSNHGAVCGARFDACARF